jgi:hypothetical protein
MGFEETDPLAALDIKKGERRPKEVTPVKETHAGFCGLHAQQDYTTLVNAFKQLFKSSGRVLLLFRSLAQQRNHLILNSSALLTSPFICAPQMSA